MRTAPSPAPQRGRSRRRRASATAPPPARFAGAAPTAAGGCSLGRRIPSPSRPLLPLIAQKSDIAARTQPVRGSRATGLRGGYGAGDDGNGSGVAGTAGAGGFLGLLECGALPADYDLEPALTSDGPMRSVRAPLHTLVADRRQRQPVMTEVSGFKQMHDFKLDYEEIERLPAKLNLSELRKWETDEAAERPQAGRAAVSSSTTGSANHAASSTAAPPATSASPSLLSRDDPRTYTELLDLYSMHEFIVRKGKTLRATPEFASFKRHYAAAWGSIEGVIAALENLLAAHGIDLAFVDGKKLAALASYQSGPDVAVEDLVECVANAEEVEPLLGNAAHQYRHGRHGHDRAAARIQSVWRMYRQRIAYKHLLLGTRAAIIIQRQWAIHRAHCTTKRTIQAVRQTRVMRWRQTMVQFCERWPRIRQSRRTVIHIPSLSYPSFHAKKVPFYMAQQLGQLTRLCELADPKVDMVLVVPFKPEPEVLAYYHSVLEEAGVVNVKGRFTMLMPEESQRLPAGMSLTRLVLLSARLMKMLRALGTGKPAFLVPGVVGPEELLLASELGLPMLGPEPHVAQVFGRKSGCHRLLEAADVATPVGARQVRGRADLLRALASLMIAHRECPRWLVKLETESGSRGHAYFDVGRMKTLKSVVLAQQAIGATAAASLSKDAGLDTGNDLARTAPVVFDLLLKELEEYGAKRVRLVHPSAYTDWAAYLDMLDTVGACIEAVPSKPVGSVTANLFVEPSGEVHLHSIVEPLLAPAYTVMGSCCPPTVSYPRGEVEAAAMRVARAAYRKRIYGYLSVDFVVFSEHAPATAASLAPAPPLQVWAVDVDLCWTNNAVAHQFTRLLSSGCDAPSSVGAPRETAPAPVDHSDPRDSPTHNSAFATLHSSPTALKGVDASYMYSGLIYNPFISSIRHTTFFSLCRSRGISYDRDRRSGVVFHLVDVLVRGCLGVLSVGPDMHRNAKNMSAFQSLLNMELPKQGEHSLDSNFAYFSAVTRQLARLFSANADA